MFTKLVKKLSVASVLVTFAVVSFVPAIASAGGGFQGDFTISLNSPQSVLEFEKGNDDTAIYPKIQLPKYYGSDHNSVDFEQLICSNAYTVRGCATVRSHDNVYTQFSSSFWPRNTKHEIYNAARTLGIDNGNVYLTAKLRNTSGITTFANRIKFNLKKANSEPVVPALPAVNLKSAGSTSDSAKVTWNYLPNNGQFGSYKVEYKKGWTNYVKGYGLKTAYTQYNYFNATNLDPQAWYSFQVVPVKWKNGKYEEVGSRSNVVKIATAPKPVVNACGASAGNDGHYSVCLNDTVTHYKSGLKAKVTYKSSNYVQVKLSGTANYYAWLQKGVAKTVHAGDYIVKLTYTGKDNSHPNTNVMIKFTSEKKAQELAQPSVIYPKWNQTLTNYPRKAYLSWTAIAGASKYELEVACDVCVSSSNKWLHPSKYTTSKNYFTTPPLAGDNQFRFRVRAVAADGTKGNWSAYRYFRYKTAPTPQPQPIVPIVPQPIIPVVPNVPVVPAPAQDVVLSANSANNAVYLDWNDVDGLGSGFDKYNIKFKKGWHANLNGYAVANSYISYGSYYNLVGLQGGSWWTFQVVPVENDGNGNYVEAGKKSNIVRVWVKN